MNWTLITGVVTTFGGIVLAWWLAERSRRMGHSQGERDALARFRLEREADEHSNRRNYYLDFLSTAEAFNRLIASTNGVGARTGDDVVAAHRLPHAAVGVLANGTPASRASAETLLGVHTAAHARIGNALAMRRRIGRSPYATSRPRWRPTPGRPRSTEGISRRNG